MDNTTHTHTHKSLYMGVKDGQVGLIENPTSDEEHHVWQVEVLDDDYIALRSKSTNKPIGFDSQKKLCLVEEAEKASFRLSLKVNHTIWDNNRICLYIYIKEPHQS